MTALRDVNGEPICGMCKKQRDNLHLEPSRKQLLFGGFPASFEYRCDDCEKILVKKINKFLGENK